MAYYAALNSVLQSLEEMSNRDRYPKLLLDKLQLACVYEKLSHLKALLEDYSPKDEEAADCLETRMRDSVYKVQYILESHDILQYKLSHLIPQKDKTHGVENALRRLSIAKWKRAMPRQLQDIEEVKEEVDSIVEEVKALKIKKSYTTEDLEVINSYSTSSKQETTSCGDTMVEFEEQLLTIKYQLCGESSKLEVIPLVGMGGIGKTTLARSIFDDKLIVSHFDCRAWVTISQNYHLQKLLLGILGSVNVDTKNLRREKECSLKEHIYKHLKWRRYLIILDDIWDTNVWDDMKMILPDDNNGSRIILTTRLLDVAVYANGRGSFHQMQFLNKDQSWDLLQEKVFGQENCPQELKVIGRLIAENCQGLPLAIVVVAGLLSMVNKTRSDWEGIARNASSIATKNDERFSKILSLSYNQLPHHLKPCLLYIGGFPEDYQIPVSKLIKLWIAEGFLKPDKFKSLEEIAEEYLEDLANRNLVLMSEKKINGKFKYCSIHDVLRDLCLERACYESFLHFVDNDYSYTKETSNIIRRLYIHHACSQLKAEEFGSHLSSILCFDGDRMLRPFAFSFKLLRVLDALQLSFCSFPIEVLELRRLRYLAIGLLVSESEFKIPPEIAKLEKLQTLVLGSEGYLIGQEIDVSQIWKMSNLRHVDVYLLELSLPNPFNCVLEDIQTLSKVVNFKFMNRAIQIIPNIKKLKVVYRTSKPTAIWEKFCLYNLVRLCQLETLNIHFDAEDPVSFPERFSFPQKLKKLSLFGCRIPWKDMTVVGSLPNLEVLKLHVDAFVGDEWEPKEGEFPKLKFLLMTRLTLKYWRAQNTPFPCLEHLKVHECLRLKEIPSEIGDIPTLKLIEVRGIESVLYSALQIQKEQRNMGNDGLQVHVYRLDNFTRMEADIMDENEEMCEIVQRLARRMLREQGTKNLFDTRVRSHRW